MNSTIYPQLGGGEPLPSRAPLPTPVVGAYEYEANPDTYLLAHYGVPGTQVDVDQAQDIIGNGTGITILKTPSGKRYYTAPIADCVGGTTLRIVLVDENPNSGDANRPMTARFFVANEFRVTIGEAVHFGDRGAHSSDPVSEVAVPMYKPNSYGFGNPNVQKAFENATRMNKAWPFNGVTERVQLAAEEGMRHIGELGLGKLVLEALDDGE